jgi:VWFA-related protein
MKLMLPRVTSVVAASIGILFSTVIAQEPRQTPAPYSESIPYRPRLFPVKPDKRSKEKKGKDTVGPAPEPAAISESEVMPGNGPAVTQIEPITIPVSVFDASGKFVTGLKREDFKLLVDGPEAQVLSVEHKDEPLNVLIVLDASPSSFFDLQKELAEKLISEFPSTDRISVLKFDVGLKQLTPLSSERAAAIKAVTKLEMGAGTSLYDANRKIFSQIVPAQTGRTVVIILTDGVDTSSQKTKYSDSLVAAEMSTATVYPIYLDTFRFVKDVKQSKNSDLIMGSILNGPVMRSSGQSIEDIKRDYEIAKYYLNDLAYLSGGRASDGESLLQSKSEFASTIAEELHQQYYLTFLPVGPSFIGERKHLTVRIDLPNLLVLTRGSYIVGSPPSFGKPGSTP